MEFLCMDKKITYHEKVTRDNTVKLRKVLATLPDFTRDYFRAIEPNTSARTRISYVYDIRFIFCARAILILKRWKVLPLYVFLIWNSFKR